MSISFSVTVDLVQAENPLEAFKEGNRAREMQVKVKLKDNFPLQIDELFLNECDIPVCGE